MESSVLSVGIDIGTTTTGMIVSRLSFTNTASGWTVPRVDITDKEILYKSELYFTPMLDEAHLDGAAIRSLLAEEYRKAGIEPSMVDSGAVIITGESALKENADAVSAGLSDFAGEFVVATAGPELESVIAGKGAGAERYSKEHSCTAANLDIGGGTTNIAVFRCGEVLGQTCLDIGGRLLRYDKNEVITYISPRLMELAKAGGIDPPPAPGMKVTPERLRRLTLLMASVLSQVLGAEPDTGLVSLMTTKGSGPLPVDLEPGTQAGAAGAGPGIHPCLGVDCISFSGGVGDCYYSGEPELYRYGDLGVSLARALEESSLTGACEVIRPKETIRATVVGAGIYTTVVSGSTITYSGNLFPMKNIPAFLSGANAERMAFQGESRALAEQLRWFLQQTGTEKAILCFRGKKKAAYEELCGLAKAVTETAEQMLPAGSPLLVLTENDMAKSLGQTILRYQRENRDVVCIDKIKAQQGDYIDIGKPLMGGLAVPVVVKTLIFR